MKCEYCGSEFETQRGARYCSRLCIQRAYRVRHQEELRISKKAWYDTHKDRARAAQMRRYGITVAEYESMYDRQNGRCKLCGQSREILHVDHDHETDVVRGLLCPQCNRMLGQIETYEIDTADIDKYLGRVWR